MPSLHNQFSMPMQALYAGVQYIIAPNSTLPIKNRRERDGMLVAEEIAAKLYDDLAAQGIILLDEDHPTVTDEMRDDSRERRATWIQQMVTDFNDLNAAQASINKPILLVPKHLKAHQKELAGLTGADQDFTSVQALEQIRARAEVSREQAIKRLVNAQETGDEAAVTAAIAELKNLSEPKAAAAEKPPDFEVRRAPGVKHRGGIRPEAASGRRA